MPDGPFKSMSRERKVELRDTFIENWYARKVEKCEKCGGLIYEGSWPWCKSGRPEEHER